MHKLNTKTLNIAYCTLATAHEHCTWTLNTTHCSLHYTVTSALDTSYCTVHIVHCTAWESGRCGERWGWLDPLSPTVGTRTHSHSLLHPQYYSLTIWPIVLLTTTHNLTQGITQSHSLLHLQYYSNSLTLRPIVLLTATHFYTHSITKSLTLRYKQDQNSTYRCAIWGLIIYNLFDLFSLPI